ncbi:hypothetical protein HY933_01025 [Candidatus Falkowbacteria bacterium]|nr:hypothetical protein [Candidatus Falkowbacteria bacterium]
MPFSTLRNSVLARAPVLRQIIETSGKLPLSVYCQQHLGGPPRVSAARQEEVFSAVRQCVSRVLGASAAAEAEAHLRQHYLVSTGDHHHPLTHPFSLNSALLRSAALRGAGRRSLVTFSCATVSLNNSSSPRGLLYHSRRLQAHRLPLFSLQYRHHPVYGLRAYTAVELARARHMVQAEKNITPVDRALLDEILVSVYADPAVLACQYYSEQITRTNAALWRRLPGQADTTLIFVPEEDMVNDLLARYHLAGQSTAVTALLTDPTAVQLFCQEFNGVAGAGSLDRSKGTILFWALREGQRLALWLDGDRLVSADGQYAVALSASALTQALQQKELMPSMALTFIVLSFYYGLTCGGGFFQGSYLAQMRQAYVRLLSALRASAEDTAAASAAATDRITADLSFIHLAKGSDLTLASALDLLLYQDDQTPTRLVALMERCTLAEAIDQLMPLFYTIFYHTPPPVSAPRPAYDALLYV